MIWLTLHQEHCGFQVENQDWEDGFQTQGPGWQREGVVVAGGSSVPGEDRSCPGNTSQISGKWKQQNFLKD